MSTPSNYCGICSQPLTDPASVALGIGPVCLKKLKIKAMQEENQNSFLIEPVWTGKELPSGKVTDLTWQSWSGQFACNVLQLVVMHSPTGFQIGYPGSGPGDLALNIAEAFLPHRAVKEWETKNRRAKALPNIAPEDLAREPVYCFKDTWCSQFAWAVHQKLKNQFLVTVPRNAGTISGAQLREFLLRKYAQFLAIEGARQAA